MYPVGEINMEVFEQGQPLDDQFTIAAINADSVTIQAGEYEFKLEI